MSVIKGGIGAGGGMILESLLDFEPPAIAARVRCGVRPDIKLYLKLECFNPGGSIKFKPALGLVRELEVSGKLHPGCTLIETTSGNMGIALSMVARARGYSFICVSDDKITHHNRALVQAYGAELVVMSGSKLADRFEYIRQRVSVRPDLVWTRQFSSTANPASHERTTALELHTMFPRLDYVFVGTGTAGTATGCARALARLRPSAKVVAVDAEGSRHFDPTGSQRRKLPGIGATERSGFLDGAPLDGFVIVPEEEAVAACHRLVSTTGWLAGASTGSVLAGVYRQQHRFAPGDVVVAISADHGERYLDSVYSEAWLAENFPELHSRAETLEPATTASLAVLT
jgi:cysteine synthase A